MEKGIKGIHFGIQNYSFFHFSSYSNPEVAKSLLTYRYHGLVGARKKATENGYEGAMYPWEMAWPTDGEVTPFGATLISLQESKRKFGQE